MSSFSSYPIKKILKGLKGEVNKRSTGHMGSGSGVGCFPSSLAASILKSGCSTSTKKPKLSSRVHIMGSGPDELD
ncbi:hypothetical protein PRUPE_1G498500 [Prunus persica]|uniref:Uncharacterized protein n=1 Tax=Prunus persica TaxID=3760 RepID=M5XP82_PRUPE|nr:hypothetical protein PRUPE_1G498500 [Prunus persica]